MTLPNKIWNAIRPSFAVGHNFGMDIGKWQKFDDGDGSNKFFSKLQRMGWGWGERGWEIWGWGWKN